MGKWQSIMLAKEANAEGTHTHLLPSTRYSKPVGLHTVGINMVVARDT